MHSFVLIPNAFHKSDSFEFRLANRRGIYDYRARLWAGACPFPQAQPDQSFRTNCGLDETIAAERARQFFVQVVTKRNRGALQYGVVLYVWYAALGIERRQGPKFVQDSEAVGLWVRCLEGDVHGDCLRATLASRRDFEGRG